MGLKLATWLFLTGGLFTSAVVFGVSRLAMGPGPARGVDLPEGAGSMTLFAVLAFVFFIGLAAAASVLQKAWMPDEGHRAGIKVPGSHATRRRWRAIVILAIGLMVLAGALFFRWSRSTTTSRSTIIPQTINRS